MLGVFGLPSTQLILNIVHALYIVSTGSEVTNLTRLNLLWASERISLILDSGMEKTSKHILLLFWFITEKR